MATQSNLSDEMSALNSQVVTSIAESLAGIGGHLECMECGEIRPLNDSDMAERITHGWPKHCGYTMRWITARELAQRLPQTVSKQGRGKNATTLPRQSLKDE